MPTPQHIVDLMLEMADVEKDDLVYDLGCGDGRIVVTAADKYGCQAVGFDIDPNCVRESRANVRDASLDKLVTIEQRDIFELDLSKADVVTLYLLAKLNERLLPQLERMKPGSRIVSHDFHIPGVEPDMEVDCYSRVHGTRDRIYLFTTPLKRLEADDEFAEDSSLERATKHFGRHTYQRLAGAALVVVLLGAIGLWLLQKLLKCRLVLRVEKRM